MAVYKQVFSEIFPSSPSFTVDDFPDQTGRVAIVTGSNTGIGKATAEVLLKKGAKVYVAARSEDKARAAIAELKETTGKTDNDVKFLKLDLGDMTTIKGTVEEFTRQEKQLHVLFNNAGIMNPPAGSTTTQNYEIQLGTNVLGHYLFTKLLLPTLLATAEQTRADSERLGYNIVRIINTSSNGHIGAPKGGFSYDNYNGQVSWAAYGQSKWGNIVHANELARRYGAQGISAHSLNPGVIGTDLTRTTPWLTRKFIGPITHPPSLGCLTQLYAGLMPESGKPEKNGLYFVPWGREGVTRHDAQGQEVGEKFWDWLEKETAPYA